MPSLPGAAFPVSMPSSPAPPSPAEIAALATKYGDGAAGLDPASEAGMLAAIPGMKAPGGFGVVIVCCSNQSAENSGRRGSSRRCSR